MSKNINDVIKLFPTVMTSNIPRTGKKVIQYKISNPIYVILENGQCSVHDGLAPQFDVAVQVKDEDLLAMFKDELSPPYAYMTGKLKIEGDLLFAQKLPILFDIKKIV